MILLNAEELSNACTRVASDDLQGIYESGLRRCIARAVAMLKNERVEMPSGKHGSLPVWSSCPATTEQDGSTCAAC